MKSLLLMRHAKSSWKQSELADHERPLNKRGKQDAQTMGLLLVKAQVIPQHILCSSAERARETTAIIVESSKYTGTVDYLEELYLTEPDAYLSVVQKLPDSLTHVMIIGHNPAVESMLQILSREIESLPTAAIAHLSLSPENWADINQKTRAELISLWRPRDFRKRK